MFDSGMSTMPDVVQLTIWDRLNLATTNSVEVDFVGLLVEVDESVDRLSLHDRLGAAGEAIYKLSEIYASRSAMQLSQIEYLLHPEREPVLPLDAFDCYVRQSMMVDLEQFIEPPELPEYEREYNLTVVRERSKAEILKEIEAVQEIEPETTYQQAIAIAHEENISEWGATISAWLNHREQPVSLLELQRSLKMPLVQVWLALLLNGFELEQRGEFYETENIWIIQKGELPDRARVG
jgi:hypothetical protein